VILYSNWKFNTQPLTFFDMIQPRKKKYLLCQEIILSDPVFRANLLYHDFSFPSEFSRWVAYHLLQWTINWLQSTQYNKSVLVNWEILKEIFLNVGPLPPIGFNSKGNLLSTAVLKVIKYRKQNTKFSHPPKNQQNFVHFFAQTSKSGWIKKIKALYCFK
jgi:hypothetical protein